MKFWKRAALAAAITVGAVGAATNVAEAHSFGAAGPPHEHHSCILGSGGDARCHRWILANGAIIQGSWTLFNQQLGYVGVLCSVSSNFSPWYNQPGNYGEGWYVNNTPIGIWGANGYHTYCVNPKYPTPGGQGGWAVNY